MDMVAAIQAAKNQLEEQKKKKGINHVNSISNTALPSIASLHPAPPTNIVSFDSKKQRSSAPHPYHTNNNSTNNPNASSQTDYIHPDFLYKSNNNSSNPDEEDDELTTTSSLSGTLPSSVIHDIPHNIHKSESGLTNSSTSNLFNNSYLDTVKESPGGGSTTNLDSGGTTLYPRPTLRSKSFIDASSPPPNVEDLTPSRKSQSFIVEEVVPTLPLKKDNQEANINTAGTQVESSSDNQRQQSVLGSGAASTSLHNKDNTNVSKRIDEIMSAYQGKVDTILKRRDEGTSFKSIMETASAQGVAGSNVSVSSSVSKRSAEGLGIDDIMSTYKKKVGEIMEKKQQQQQQQQQQKGSTTTTYDDDMETRRQELSARSRPSYPRSIVDDETTESREGAIDASVAGSQASRGRSRSPGSYSGSETRSRSSSYTGTRSYTGSESYNRTRVETSVAKEGPPGVVASAPLRKSAGPMSERANAIRQSLDAKQPQVTTALRGQSPERNGDDDDGSRSIYSEESYSTNGSHSYISGASSASNALGSTYSQPQDKPVEDEGNNITPGNQDKPESLLRKDSLRQAQAQLARKPITSTKSFYCEPNTTKSNLHAEIETERKYRQDLERRLAESTQREEDLSNVNRRIEKTLADLQSQLDKVQGDARSNKYSQSEQAAKIRELERKLKGEQNRVEELEREKDAMKEEVSAANVKIYHVLYSLIF